MVCTEKELLELLDTNSVEYEYISHVPLFTCEQALEVMKGVSGIPSKNLFLVDTSGSNYLISTTDKKRVDLKVLAQKFGVKKFSFGSAETLREKLGLEPGSVTVFGAINDRENHVKIFLDRDIWNGDLVQCHPLVNTSTLVIKVSEVKRFFEIINHPVEALDVPVKQ